MANHILSDVVPFPGSISMTKTTGASEALWFCWCFPQSQRQADSLAVTWVLREGYIFFTSNKCHLFVKVFIFRWTHEFSLYIHYLLLFLSVFTTYCQICSWKYTAHDTFRVQYFLKGPGSPHNCNPYWVLTSILSGSPLRRGTAITMADH